MADVVRITSDRTIEVAGRTFPATFTIEDDGDRRVRRARVLFEGTQVGVSWGSASYSDNGGVTDDTFTDEPHRVEVTVFPDGGPTRMPHVEALTLRAMLQYIAGGGSVETIVETWRAAAGVPPPA